MENLIFLSKSVGNTSSREIWAKNIYNSVNAFYVVALLSFNKTKLMCAASISFKFKVSRRNLTLFLIHVKLSRSNAIMLLLMVDSRWITASQIPWWSVTISTAASSRTPALPTSCLVSTSKQRNLIGSLFPTLLTATVVSLWKWYYFRLSVIPSTNRFFILTLSLQNYQYPTKKLGDVFSITLTMLHAWLTLWALIESLLIQEKSSIWRKLKCSPWFTIGSSHTSPSWYHMYHYGIVLYCMVLYCIVWYCISNINLPSHHPSHPPTRRQDRSTFKKIHTI